jgi:hypothetical protein
MARKRGKEDDDVFSLHPSDGSFNIKPAHISHKKKNRKKKDVEAELHNTKMDLIQ